MKLSEYLPFKLETEDDGEGPYQAMQSPKIPDGEYIAVPAAVAQTHDREREAMLAVVEAVHRHLDKKHSFTYPAIDVQGMAHDLRQALVALNKAQGGQG